MAETDNTAAGLFTLGLMLVFYFLPPIVAAMREHRHTAAIFILTLFLGWTALGWIIALVWAFMNQRRERPAPAPQAAETESDEPRSTPEHSRRYPSLEEYNREVDDERPQRRRNR